MAFIRVINQDDADGDLGREYAKALKRAGRIYNVIKIQGLRPAALRDSVRLYIDVMHGPGELTRAEREMIAVVVSAANACHY
jgi:alkylhydroperoxidase family enzyme